MTDAILLSLLAVWSPWCVKWMNWPPCSMSSTALLLTWRSLLHLTSTHPTTTTLTLQHTLTLVTLQSTSHSILLKSSPCKAHSSLASLPFLVLCLFSSLLPSIRIPSRPSLPPSSQWLA